MKLLEIKNLSFNFPNFPTIWEDLNLEIPQGSFTALFGPSGSGKSALLRQLIYKLEPYGKLTGDIFYQGRKLSSLSPEERIEKIAFVTQNPEDQIISESVWQELSFTLENLAVPAEEMRNRIAEISNFFGIQEWFWQKTNELSGGQKQILSLASALVVKPDLLILDEPDSSLDPVTQSEFLSIIKRLNTELGITILISSHNWSKVLPLVDQVLYLDDKNITSYNSAKEFILNSANTSARHALPAASQLGLSLSNKPLLTVSEAKQELNKNSTKINSIQLAEKQEKEDIVDIKDLSFRYNKGQKNILNHLNLAIPEQSISFIMGANGSGKSSLLKCIIDQVKYQGKIKWQSKNIKKAYLPQNPRLLFSAETIVLELEHIYKKLDDSDLNYLSNLFNIYKHDLSASRILEEFGLGHRLDFHPDDLSGGELQRAALAQVLLDQTDLLILDEPSSNLAPNDREYLKTILKNLRANGMTVIAVSHDLEFCAEVADNAALLFQGEIINLQEPHKFFNDNYFYTTDACRIAQPFTDGLAAITVDELLRALPKGV